MTESYKEETHQVTAIRRRGAGETAGERLLRRQLREVGEDIIADILPIRVSPSMSVSTLRALATVFNLRSELAFESRESAEPAYANLQCVRLEQIGEALTVKYPKAKTLNERIEILGLHEESEQCLAGCHSPLALAEAPGLADAPGLTDFGRLRLSWLAGVDASDCDATVSALLPRAKDAFDIATLSLIKDHCGKRQREAIIEKFNEIFEEALSNECIAELGTLLTTAADWNESPVLRPRLAELARRAAAVDCKGPAGSVRLTVPEKRVNAIAAEIHTRLDALTSGRGAYDYIPA